MAGRIDETLPFHPLNIAVLTISDTRDETTDTSGGTLVERLEMNMTDPSPDLPDFLSRIEILCMPVYLYMLIIIC